MEAAVARATAKGTSRDRNPIRTTSGELFPDGSAIELVTTGTADDSGLGLLFWDGEQSIIAPQIKHGGKIYEPLNLHPSLREAVKLPREAAPYGKTEPLVANVREIFERYLGLPVREATLLALWAITTWFSDCVSSPPTLSLSGPDMSLGVTLLVILNSLSRHPLLLTDITRRGFCSLVPLLRPTLLVNQPGLAPKILALWHATNFHGLFVPGKGGTVVNVTCSKAFFGGLENAACPWTDAAIHLALPPAQGGLPRFDERLQRDIAERYQPQLLMYRLQNFRRVREYRSVADESGFSNRGVARDLAACVQGEQDIVQAVTPLLQPLLEEESARRSWDPNLAIIEVIWIPSHTVKELPVDEITGLTNTLLRDRGETLEYSSEEVGWKLRAMGFYRRRNGNGMVLRFSRDNILRIHQLAERFALKLTVVDGCSDCALRK
jgi:hypothetical protein